MDTAQGHAPPARARTAPYRFFHVRNAVTYVGIGAALSASVFSGDPSRRALVGQCLALATLTDLLDGRFARLFRCDEHDKRFGVQLDSLADVLVFGFTPVICLFRYSPALTGALGLAWLSCGLFYALCAVTRLGYFNMMADEQSGFVGVPTTVFGVFWSGWLLLEGPSPAWTMAALALCGLAMVSPFRIRRPGVKGLAVVAAVAVALICAHGL